MAKNIVHVVGTGTIGEPLTGMLSDFRDELGLDEVTFHKRTPLLTDRSKVAALIKRGARFVTDSRSFDGFREIGLHPELETHEALDQAAVVIDCTPSGIGQQNKAEYYERFTHNTRGFIAQGSESGFGKPYARQINDRVLDRDKDQFIQVVSCNTHNLSVLVDCIALADGGEDNLVQGRFVCIRRANDISQSSSFVPSPSVSAHDDAAFGTHHARDAYHLFQTLGLELNLFSSALKVNTQYMHTVHFDLELAEPTTRAGVTERLRENPHVAVTNRSEQNLIFSFGRDYGHYGRILDNTVVVLPSLHVSQDGCRVTGFCFTPQDGNSILSSLAATLWFLDPARYEARLDVVAPYMFDEV